MRNKRFLSMFLASAMSLVMAVPALATSANTQSITVEGATNAPTIALTVQNPGQTVTLNPYGMEHEIPYDATTLSTDTIIFNPVIIENRTDAALKANATVTGKAGTGSGAVFLAAKKSGSTETAPDLTTGGKKNVFMYYEAIDTNTDNLSTIDRAWADSYTGASNQIAVGAKTEKKGVVELAAVGDGNASNYAVFTLKGDTNSAPTVGDWTATDTVNVTVAMTFSPVAAKATDLFKEVEFKDNGDVDVVLDITNTDATKKDIADGNGTFGTAAYKLKIDGIDAVISGAEDGSTHNLKFTIDKDDVSRLIGNGKRTNLLGEITYKDNAATPAEKTKSIKIRVTTKDIIATQDYYYGMGEDLVFDLKDALEAHEKSDSDFTKAANFSIKDRDDNSISGVSLANGKVTITAAALEKLLANAAHGVVDVKITWDSKKTDNTANGNVTVYAKLGVNRIIPKTLTAATNFSKAAAAAINVEHGLAVKAGTTTTVAVTGSADNAVTVDATKLTVAATNTDLTGADAGDTVKIPVIVTYENDTAAGQTARFIIEVPVVA